MIMVDLDPRQSLTIFRTSSMLLFVVLFATCFVAAIKDDEESFLFPNREHKVFNVIGSALRTEASVANPNGMSAFLAYVDKGSFLFHGTFKQDEVKGFEWVAFDPNFASLFARWESGRTNSTVPTQPPIPLPHTDHDTQAPLTLVKSDKSADLGNLRTYKAQKDLRLLYLDGLSAIKRDDGPLDFQNIIFLSNRTITHLQDLYRAEKMCEMNRNRWNGRIDGFIRKHYELEMILCSFEDSLEEINRITLPYLNFEKDMIWNPGWTGKVLPNEARDETITKANVHVNFDQFVSVWDYPIEVYNKEGQSFPRLNRISKEEREIVLRAVDELVLGGEQEYCSDFINWQNIVDSIVARFKPVFQAFDVDLDDGNNWRWANKSAHESVFIYVDVLNRSNEKEMQRCTTQMYKIPQNPTVASRSVQAVLQVLCSTMLDVYDEKDIRNSQKRLKQLSEILYWTPWTHYQRDKIEPW